MKSKQKKIARRKIALRIALIIGWLLTAGVLTVLHLKSKSTQEEAATKTQAKVNTATPSAPRPAFAIHAAAR